MGEGSEQDCQAEAETEGSNVHGEIGFTLINFLVPVSSLFRKFL